MFSLSSIFRKRTFNCRITDSALTGPNTSWFNGATAQLDGKFEGNIGSGGYVILAKK